MATVAEWLIDRLDDDLANRRRELIDLRLQVATTRGAREAALSRTCVVMAYAHWEGFTKQAFRLYLEHLVKLRLKIVDLKYELQALCLFAKMKGAMITGSSVGNAAALLKDLDARSSDIFVVDGQQAVRVGNMTSENLKLLLELTALQYMPAYAMRENFIDSVVCKNRHLIAHGEMSRVAAADARSIVADVIALCQDVNNQVQTAAVYREYLI